MGAQLRLEGKSGLKPANQDIADMRGDAVLYLWDKADVSNALGYHERNNSVIPFGFVFTEVSKQLGESWTVTLSHEALELIADPEVSFYNSATGTHETFSLKADAPAAKRLAVRGKAKGARRAVRHQRFAVGGGVQTMGVGGRS